MNLVSSLQSVAGALPTAGGKGANLGALIRAGFDVPAGFVVTTEAYALAAAGLELDVSSAVERGDGARIRAALESATVPPDLAEAITRAHAQIGDGPVAVRSSATAEDLPGAAFAGQHDTYLNVVGHAALLDAVRRCWASLWTDRAIDYRKNHDVDSDSVRIAVVVQQMVDAELAGVMFTADPVTGARDRIVIDASPGLGEAVVSGLVTPDHYVVDAAGRTLEFTPGRAEVVIRSAAGGGVQHEHGDAATGAPISDAMLAELARTATAVATLFGRPQDLEWAIADGRLQLLQSRAMTALPPPRLELGHIQRLTGAVALEMLPIRPYPIDMSTWVAHGPAGLMADLGRHFGIRGVFDDFIVEQDGVAYQLVPPRPRPTLKALATPFKLIRLALKYDPARWTEDPVFIDFLRRVREVDRMPLRPMPWRDLVRMPRRILDLIEPMTDLRIRYLPRAGLATARLAIALKLLGRSSLLGELAAGAHTRTRDANAALEELAGIARHDGVDFDHLDAHPEFQARFQTFLDEFGHRETATAMLVTPPTWRDEPQVVIGLIKALAVDDHRQATPRPDPMRRLHAHPLLRMRWLRRLLDRWVAAARAGFAFREDSHFFFTMPMPMLRGAILEIGRRLHDAGVLAEPADVFHLRLEELERITDPDRLSAEQSDLLRATVNQRERKRDELAGVPLIDPTLLFPPKELGDALVQGVGASPGTATGPVRVIRDPSEFERLRAGEVLVCAYTNPAWTPLFQRAVAVVCDAGAVGSHAAITAREYGIPAVMGTASGTRTLVDGTLVTVDGSRGRVVAAAGADDDG